jgi:hypothetical protein
LSREVSPLVGQYQPAMKKGGLPVQYWSLRGETSWLYGQHILAIKLEDFPD